MVVVDFEFNSGGNYLYFFLCFVLINKLYVVLNEINVYYLIIIILKNMIVLVKLYN